MDEMTRLRELRADAPAPDRSALAPGRQRLTDAIAGKRHGRRPWADWRIASVGPAVAVTVAALLGTQLLDTSDPRSAGPATVAGDLDLSGPAEALGRAADFLEGLAPPPEPRADQWIYTRKVVGEPEVAAEKDRKGAFSYDPDSWTPLRQRGGGEGRGERRPLGPGDLPGPQRPARGPRGTAGRGP